MNYKEVIEILYEMIKYKDENKFLLISEERAEAINTAIKAMKYNPYQAGYNHGYEAGYIDGHADGFNECMEVNI